MPQRIPFGSAMQQDTKEMLTVLLMLHCPATPQGLDAARSTVESAARRLSQISSEIGDDRPISGVSALARPQQRRDQHSHALGF
jgi:hypothetical protein